jgi:hypothetical protein
MNVSYVSKDKIRFSRSKGIYENWLLLFKQIQTKMVHDWYWCICVLNSRPFATSTRISTFNQDLKKQTGKPSPTTRWIVYSPSLSNIVATSESRKISVVIFIFALNPIFVSVLLICMNKVVQQIQTLLTFSSAISQRSSLFASLLHPFMQFHVILNLFIIITVKYRKKTRRYHANKGNY